MSQNIWWPQKLLLFFFLNQQLIKKNMSIKIMFLLLLTKNMKADSLIKSEG